MKRNLDSGMEAVERTQNFPMSVISGRAERKKSRPTTSKNSNSLKDMSMSEILKLAEDRAKVEGVGRQLTDNPWHKRIAVSDNVTRHQTPSNALINHQQTGLDNNEEFFENLMKKMTEEQFMSYGKENRKRTRLWNKENSTSSDRMKRQKESRINAKLIPPRMNLFAKRLLPRLNNNDSPTEGRIQSQRRAAEGRDEDPRKSTLDVIQEHRNTKEVNSRFRDLNSTTTMMTEDDESFHWNENPEYSVSCTQETLKLDRSWPINKMGFDSTQKSSPRHYYVNKYPRKLWDSPRLSSIKEYRQLSMIVESPVLHTIDTGFNVSVHLTPPILRESSDCEACNIDKVEYEDSVNNHYCQLLSPTISLDSDRAILGIVDKSLFT